MPHDVHTCDRKSHSDIGAQILVLRFRRCALAKVTSGVPMIVRQCCVSWERYEWLFGYEHCADVGHLAFMGNDGKSHMISIVTKRQSYSNTTYPDSQSWFGFAHNVTCSAPRKINRCTRLTGSVCDMQFYANGWNGESEKRNWCKVVISLREFCCSKNSGDPVEVCDMLCTTGDIIPNY